MAALAETDEIPLRTRRRDETSRSPRAVWVVVDGDRVIIRSTKRTRRQLVPMGLSTGRGRFLGGDVALDVRVREVHDETEHQAADAGPRDTYARCASIVDHLLTPGPREATLEIVPDR